MTAPVAQTPQRTITLATDLPLTDEQRARILAVDERIAITGPGNTDGAQAADVHWTASEARFGDDSDAAVIPAGAPVDAAPRAEFALHAMLHFAKHRNVEQHPNQPPAAPMGDLRGRTLLVVGLGAVGSEIARIGNTLGMRVLGMNTTGRTDDPNIERIRTTTFLGDLLPVSHYVVLALPLTDTTRGVIGAGAVAKMRSDAVVTCIGSGAVLDDTALAEALAAGHATGAAFDAYAAADLPAGSPLRTRKDVLISPHDAGESVTATERLLDRYLPALHRYVRGEHASA